jgi:COP9 signalosome complex subunit 6
MSATAAHGTVNPLLSMQKSSDGLQVSLHPLPLLEISDYITRSFQRGYKGALVGALLGEQKGREVTIEHSFTCGVQRKDGHWSLDTEQFVTRLEESTSLYRATIVA